MKQKPFKAEGAMLPREKALSYGIRSLTDVELMAIIFGTGIQGKNVLDMCREILDSKNGHLSLIASMECNEMVEAYKGIGVAKAMNLLAALELGVRASADALTVENPPITSSDKAYAIFLEKMRMLDHEEFWVLYLDNAAHKICVSRHGQGGISMTAVDVRLILREALMVKASAMIVAHNHPSGQLQPSVQDKELTRKIKKAAELIDIRLHDHLIVTDSTYYSFNDMGEMPV